MDSGPVSPVQCPYRCGQLCNADQLPIGPTGQTGIGDIYIEGRCKPIGQKGNHPGEPCS